MIVTIDGPSASGKTSVAREIAHRLGFALLRTGAMYRALALAAHRHQLDDRSQEATLLQQLHHWQIDADEDFVFLNGTDVSQEIEGQTMSHLSSLWAEVPDVRKHINSFIRQRAASYLVDGRSFVAEGRDQGSFVFPEAECKFYIDADVNVRAQRRLKDLHHREDWSKTQQQLVDELNKRDTRDRNRSFAPLCIPTNAIVIDSTHLTIEAVIDQLMKHIRSTQERSA